ncbi:conserved hypothetical protein [Photobacterium leiognathi lrivu.4.1]|uniref:Uncharacterized protein n=1 Tax=Photobacterium leiognathi lrivu.4.1 TaxID=1248232 RepID=V5F9G6_PHOLE|nr:conserved hypothetical protein [Photobacterium leiognathi lrivu.4.1]
MKRKIEELKSSVFKDEIYNPLLINFSFDKYNKLLDSTEKGSDIEKTNEVKSKIDKIKSIIEKENYLIINDGDEDTRIKRILMESSISSKYKNVDNVYNIIEERILSIDKSIEWSISSVIDKVYILFIKDIEELIIDNSFSRLKYQSARDYYKAFIDKKHRFNLKEHISDTLSYFYKIRNSQSGREFYIGDSYGEFKKKDLNNSRFSYIDLSKKDSKELVKIKLESDFISYRLNEFVNILFELGLITKKDYEMHIYGTTNKLNSEFVKIGMSGSLVNKFNEDDQIKNLTINSYGIIECNDIFKEYINKQDDLIKFEVSKFIE